MVPQPLRQCYDIINHQYQTDAQKADVNLLILPRIDASSKLANKIARLIAIVAKTNFDTTASTSKIIRTIHLFEKLFTCDFIWIQGFHWPNITTCISLCLCYAWAVFHYQLFQRKRNNEHKHKKKEKNWSFCLLFHPFTMKLDLFCLRLRRQWKLGLRNASIIYSIVLNNNDFISFLFERTNLFLQLKNLTPKLKWFTNSRQW